MKRKYDETRNLGVQVPKLVQDPEPMPSHAQKEGPSNLKAITLALNPEKPFLNPP